MKTALYYPIYFFSFFFVRIKMQTCRKVINDFFQRLDVTISPQSFSVKLSEEEEDGVRILLKKSFRDTAWLVKFAGTFQKLYILSPTQ